MTHTITFKDGTFFVKTSGDMEVEGYIAYYREILSRKEWLPGGRVISDHRELRGMSIDVPDPLDKVHFLADFFRENADRLGRAIIACVVPDREAERASVLWDTIRKHMKVDVHFSAFYDPEEAEEWLSSF